MGLRLLLYPFLENIFNMKVVDFSKIRQFYLRFHKHKIAKKDNKKQQNRTISFKEGGAAYLLLYLFSTTRKKYKLISLISFKLR